MSFQVFQKLIYFTQFYKVENVYRDIQLAIAKNKFFT